MQWHAACVTPTLDHPVGGPFCTKQPVKQPNHIKASQSRLCGLQDEQGNPAVAFASAQHVFEDPVTYDFECAHRFDTIGALRDKYSGVPIDWPVTPLDNILSQKAMQVSMCRGCKRMSCACQHR